ncbi:hypothetical protein AC249_AIPGENE20735 [Exaiptasia diaphana]|nr:hypothetical protein AC249_AIPGENE20735 [Exaiptasia diaphana]
MLNLDNNDKVVIRDFLESADGKFLSKPESLLLTETTKSKKECCFKCVQNKECVSVNVITVDHKSLRCELLNWTGTGFEKYLVPKISSEFLQIKKFLIKAHNCR